MKELNASLVIGVAGGTGSGKTTVVELIRSKYASVGVSILDQDSYYKDQSHLSKQQRDSLNFDHPLAMDHDLLLSHLQELRRGNSIQKPCYSFTSHTRTGEVQVIRPAGLILVEGILALHDPRIRLLMDLKLYVHADPDVRFIRRLKRDVSKRGRTMGSVITQYLKSVRPMHNQHIEPTKKFADLVLDTTESVDQVMNSVERAITAAWNKQSHPQS